MRTWIGIVTSLLLVGLIGGAFARADDIPPPPPPPAPGSPPTPGSAPEPAPGRPPPEPSALDRYQDCFQRMIDAGISDNAYMKKCLGLPDKGASSSRPGARGEAAFLGKADVLEVIQKNLPALRDCYDKLLAQSKGLGLTPEGGVDARFDVQADGSVDAVGFDPTSMADVGLLGCFRQRLKAWTFPRTANGSRLSVRVSLRLAVRSGNGKAAPSVATVTVAKGSPKLDGPGYGLSPEDILAVFRKNVPKVRSCYDDLVKRKPTAGGKATIELLVNQLGRVSKVGYREFTVEDEGFKACVTTQLRTWHFPKPRSDEATTVRYPPLVFSPPSPPARGGLPARSGNWSALLIYFALSMSVSPATIGPLSAKTRTEAKDEAF